MEAQDSWRFFHFCQSGPLLGKKDEKYKKGLISVLRSSACPASLKNIFRRPSYKVQDWAQQQQPCLLHKTKIFLVQMKIAILLRVCITRIYTDFKRPEKYPRMPKQLLKYILSKNNFEVEFWKENKFCPKIFMLNVFFGDAAKVKYIKLVRKVSLLLSKCLSNYYSNWIIWKRMPWIF